MSVRRLAALAALAVLLPAHVALAQSQTAGTPSGIIKQNLASNTIAVASADEEAAQGRGSGAARKYIPRVFGGLLLGDNTGFTLGGGVSLHPFKEAKHEIQGNVAFNHIEDSNGVGLDFDYLYNFTESKFGTFTPYAGGGVNIMHFGGDCIQVPGFGEACGGGDTDTHLQIGGGVKKPLKGGKDFFGELYIVLSDPVVVIIRAGLSW